MILILAFVKGGRTCHDTAKCIQHNEIIGYYEWWTLSYRYRPLIGQISPDSYGHLEVECCDRLGLCSVEYKNAVVQRKDEIIEFCNRILTKLFWDKSFYNKVEGKRRSMGIYLNPGE